MSKSNRVLAYRVGKEPEVIDLPGGLESWQGFVGGDLFQMVPFGVGDLEFVCNENGKLHGLPMNRVFHAGDIIVGDFFVTKTDPETGDSADLTDEDIAAARVFFDRYPVPR